MDSAHSGSPAQHENRLAQAASPYLLQHAHNPVDWYEWGAAALARARRENRPIFLSIGYAACHWCHVMAHESFEDDTTAAVMNRHFVCVKVDREERPDIDEIYMRATVLMNRGQGGWPMSVFLTPDLKPFFAGTYFPRESRYGLMGFKDLCARVADVWETKRAAVEADAARLTEAVVEHLQTQPATAPVITLDVLTQVADALGGAFDPNLGGILSGATNKFPPSMTIELLLRSAARLGVHTPAGRKLLAPVELTLDQMARGGIYDQLAGGICRYSTDPEWLVPHFEKMLYDQALVSRVYIEAWRLTRNPQYAAAARSIFDYVISDLQSPAGGFYSARDADSEGQEGKYYVWTRAEVLEVLGPQDGELFCVCYGVSAAGNWSDPHEPGVAKNVLHVVRPPEEAAKALQVSVTELERRLSPLRDKMLAARAKRVPPALDDKVLCEWNGLMIGALARGGAALNEVKYVQAAARAADAILRLQSDGGRLHRAWRGGRRSEAAFLTDYAALIEGLLDLYEATFERRWLDAAVRLNGTVLQAFGDSQAGGFFFTADTHEQLLTRSKDIRDSATPSGNSIQLANLLRLAVITGAESLRAAADRMLTACGANVLQSLGAAERFLCGAELALVGATEIAVVGDPHDAGTCQLLRAAQEAYLPNRVLMLLDPANPQAAPESPLLAGRSGVADVPLAFVCRNYACQQPARTPEELRKQLEPARR